MAVDAQRLSDMLLGTGHHQPFPAHGRAGAATPMSGAAAVFSPCYGTAVGSQQPYTGGLVTQPAPTPTSAVQDQYTAEFLAMPAVDLAKRGVRLDGSQEMIAGYKRKRDEQSPVLGAANVLAAHAQQQMIVVDGILLKHAAKMWTALAEQRKKDMRLIISTVEARAAKRLKAKDEEIERIRSMNWALQERLRNLYVEAQMWRGMARSNEAAANVLRSDLHRALDAQAARGGGSGDAEDAGSCCRGDNRVAYCGDEEEEEEVRTPVVAGVGTCKGCGKGAAVVLLLPCRHLCVCASCAAAVGACPVCGCAKNGSVCINFS